MRSDLITYEEAQKLIPIFDYSGEAAPDKEIRMRSRAISRELRNVRKKAPDSFPEWSQIQLSPREFEVYEIVKRTMGV